MTRHSSTTTVLTILGAALLVAVLAAPAAQAQSTGSADFTVYVALGDSLTHGFSSGGVVNTVQVNSYPALIARQAGATDFQQPLISEPGIPALLELRRLVPSPVILPRSGGNGQPTNLALPRPYNNLGVSGYNVRDILQKVTANPLVDTVLRGLGSPLQQAVALHPTFVTVWAGNNDVLGAATSGRVIEGITLTPLAQFTADYQTLHGVLHDAGADLAVATIPRVTALPFVTTIPPFVATPVGNVPLIGPAGPLTANDRVLLSASALLATGIGVPAALGGTGLPLPDDVVLSAAEIGAIEARRQAFNQVIRDTAAAVGAPVAPVDQIFDDIVAHGYPVGGGIEYSAAFLTGGIFSYDGVHATPFGYALVANAFIDAINAGYNATIPRVDLLPFVFGSAGSGGATVPVTGASSVVFSAAAEANLRWALRVPSKQQLRRHGGTGDAPDPAAQPQSPTLPVRPALDPEIGGRPGMMDRPRP
jgi:lysophospholipase L1-like esterase